MSTKGKVSTVGYCRPPKQHQWKKGQSGNLRRAPGRATKKQWQIVEDVLAKKVSINDGSGPREGTTLELILLQLWTKASMGNGQAHRVFRRYEAFAKTKPDVVVIPDEDPAYLAEQYRLSLEGCR